MSPAPDDLLHKYGGLTEAEIDLRITRTDSQRERESREAMEKLTHELGEKVSQAISEVNTRMTGVESTVSEVKQMLHVSLASTSAWQKKMEELHLGWHDADLTYRDSIHQWRAEQEPEIKNINAAMTRMGGEIRDLRHRMKLISWLLVASKYIRDSLLSLSDAADATKKFAVWLAGFCSAALLIWQVFHSMLPALHNWLHAH